MMESLGSDGKKLEVECASIHVSRLQLKVTTNAVPYLNEASWQIFVCDCHRVNSIHG